MQANILCRDARCEIRLAISLDTSSKHILHKKTVSFLSSGRKDTIFCRYHSNEVTRKDRMWGEQRVSLILESATQGVKELYRKHLGIVGGKGPVVSGVIRKLNANHRGNVT